MAACVHVALALRLKYKNMGAHLLVFAGTWYDIYAIIFCLPSEKYENMETHLLVFAGIWYVGASATRLD
jgi:hypothetical protein